MSITSLYNRTLREDSFLVWLESCSPGMQLFNLQVSTATVAEANRKVTQDNEKWVRRPPNNLADTIMCQSHHSLIIMPQLCTSINYCMNKGSALFKMGN